MSFEHECEKKKWKNNKQKQWNEQNNERTVHLKTKKNKKIKINETNLSIYAWISFRILVPFHKSQWQTQTIRLSSAQTQTHKHTEVKEPNSEIESG